MTDAPLALTINRIIRAPRHKVFAAWTEPTLLTRWWGPGPITCPEAEVDLREGGAYRLANRELDGSITWIFGRFERVRAPEELIYTWNVSVLPGDAMLVRVRFLDHAEGTELVLIHERLASEASRDMHGRGWEGCLDKLEVLLAGDGPAVPPAATGR